MRLWVPRFQGVSLDIRHSLYCLAAHDWDGYKQSEAKNLATEAVMKNHGFGHKSLSGTSRGIVILDNQHLPGRNVHQDSFMETYEN